MTRFTFDAHEYNRDDTFSRARYEFQGSEEEGWVVVRNGENHLSLGPGHRLLRVLACGICSTDIARRFLPFPLPQILGHEVVATDPDRGGQYVAEINDTCVARGDIHPDPFCRAGLPTHCPERMVLGIDRLPGGFGPFILAPVHAVIPADTLPLRTAALVEPFAAALHAVHVSRPQKGDRIAVLGAGRLGSLIIIALSAWRKSSGTGCSLTALDLGRGRRKHALSLGADEAVDLDTVSSNRLKEEFDLVFDASGSPSGLATALLLARREVHLKSTHGQPCFGLRHLTEMVVDEIALLPYSGDSLSFKWDNEHRSNRTAYCAPGARTDEAARGLTAFAGSATEAAAQLSSGNLPGNLPRFDLGIASTAEEIDGILRPLPSDENSLVRPRGAILVQGGNSDNPVLKFLASGRRIRTSRCGDFHQAMALLEDQPALAEIMTERLITHEAGEADLPRAFVKAREADMRKVLIIHDDQL